MKLLVKYSRDLLIILLLSGIYLLVRTFYLTHLPMFTDEAIYTRWAQIALHDANWRFISLTDGKQPLFIWVMMIMMKLIPDPLLAGRLTSVLSGLGTMIGLFFLSYEVFRNKWVGYLTMVLYISFPFAMVVDRMAMYDSMVAFFAVWVLYVAILLVKHVRWDLSYTLGFVAGAGLLTKTNALISILLLPFTLLQFDFQHKQWKKRLGLWILFAVFAFVISQIFYSILRLSPFFHIIAEKNLTFVYSFSEWKQHPFTFLSGNLRGLSTWLWQYLTIFYVALFIYAVATYKRYWREKLLLFIYFIAPFFGLALLGRVLFPRFMFPMIVPFLPVAGLALYDLSQFLLQQVKMSKQTHYIRFLVPALVTLVFIAYPAFISYSFATDPVHAKLASADRIQYVNNWTAGWGLKESVAYFKDQAKDKKIYIATEGTFGLLPYGLELYLVNNPNITIKGFWPFNDTLPQEAVAKAKVMPAYFVFYQPQHYPIPPQYPLELISSIKAGDSDNYYRIYKIVPR